MHMCMNILKLRLEYTHSFYCTSPKPPHGFLQPTAVCCRAERGELRTYSKAESPVSCSIKANQWQN